MTFPKVNLAICSDQVRIANQQLNEHEFLTQRLVLDSMPTLVFVELTQNCNLSCRMCRSAGHYDSSLDMPVELFEKVQSELFASATWVDLRGWGESTILPEFSKRLASTIESGVRVRLVTNALAMTDELWEMFCRGSNSVAVSLDSVDPRVFANLGRGDLSRVLRNLRRGLLIQRKYGVAEIYLNSVASSFTLAGLPSLVRTAGEMRISRVMVNPINCSVDSDLHLGHVREMIPRVIREVEENAWKYDVKVQFGGALSEASVVVPGLSDSCSNPWNNMLIDSQGRVGFCHHLIGHHEMTFGSILETSAQKIWNGPAFQELRRQHIAAASSRRLSSAFSKCNWCYKYRYVDFEHSVLPALSSRLISTFGELPLVSANPTLKQATTLLTDSPFAILQ